MMNVNLTQHESELLLQLLENRLLERRSSQFSKNAAIIERIIEKIINNDYYFSDMQITNMLGCIIENIKKMDSEITYLNNKTALDWLNISEADKKLVEYVDSYHSIFNKINANNKKQVYSKIFDLIDRIKKCKLIGIASNDNRSNIYKIGFIDSTEYVPLSKPFEIDLKNLSFEKFKSLKHLKETNEYSEILERQIAKQIIIKANPLCKNLETWDFIKQII